MNATKRKFNALLNGIGNKSTTSVSSEDINNSSQDGGDTDSLAKKRRVAPSSSASPQKFPSNLKKSTNPNAMVHQKSLSTASGLLSAETPKYAPWDRTAFLKRLKSFSNLSDWTPKPARVDEVEWAKRGWVCQKLERVRCCLCNVELLVKLNLKEEDGKEKQVLVAHNIEAALVEKYVELIITSHEGNCLWRKRGCDDSIFKLSLTNTSVTLQSLRERYDELCARKNDLPYDFNLRLPQGFDVGVILSYLPPNFFASSTEIATEAPKPADINRVAFQMALFGWQGHVHDKYGVQLGSASCEACFRVLGLWLFKSKKVNEAGEEVEGAVVNCLDVVREHRNYCPWQSAVSQNGSAKSSTTASMAGWEIILRVLKNDYYLKHNGDRPAGNTRANSADKTSEISSFGGDVNDKDAQSITEDKDKERWARLRRVKSLFDTKAGKKLHRSDSKRA